MKERAMNRITRCASLAIILLAAARFASAAVLSVDADPQHWKEINDHLYGVNIANWAADHYLRLCEPMLVSAKVSVVRYGATNIERYNWRNNRMYNVISLDNQYVPMCWESFVDWCKEIGADPFLQVSVFGHVASDEGAAHYSYEQTLDDVADWIQAAGTNVPIWGVGNEPFIAWKLVEYQGDGYAYNDGAHGDQIFLEDLHPDHFYDRWTQVGAAIRSANSNAIIVGPTPANWYLYWGTDYSPFCPATRAEPGAYLNDPGWRIMSSGVNQFDGRVFPGRAGAPGLVGWEQNEITGEFNAKRVMSHFVRSIADYAATHGGTQVCDYLDFHRYMNCDQDAVAVQEVRDLWDPDYQSWDKETGAGGEKAMILNRFQNIIDHYYTNMHMSLSEYDYFYWQGHPHEPQISALGQIDYLGTFANRGIQLACNWYVGEPDQSGGGYHNAVDAAKQAMFTETAEPNPKYWAFKLMSLNFRDQMVHASSSDNNMFSVYAGLDTAQTQLMVVAHYKGMYHPWYLPRPLMGAFIEGQGASNATLIVSNFNITGVKSVQRYGRWDPGIVQMEPSGVSVTGNSFSYDFQPLSIYLFTLHGSPNPPAETSPDTYLNISPTRIDFGPYETGSEVHIEEDHDTHEILSITTNYTVHLKITNNRNSNTTWGVSESCDWLSVLAPTSGISYVTDRVFFTVDRTGLPVGVHSTDVTVATSEGTLLIPVTMEVVPGESDGEIRISDFDTGSLAHTWTEMEPYAIGFYDSHGQPPDRTNPYVYMMSLDYNEKSRLGGLASLRVDFDRTNGDNADGRLYLAFGTYGHTAGSTNSPATMWLPPGANPADYALKFDVRGQTEGDGFTRTRFIVLITDVHGHQGKPNVGIENFKGSMEIEDGFWQTITIPLDSEFFDWRYPGGQNGNLTAIDFSAIQQLEFAPWIGHEDRKGTIWIDNIRIETKTASGNTFPIAVADQDKRLIGTNEVVQLSGAGSYDADGSIASYSWSPSTGLSSTSIPNPVFTPPGPGQYVFELTVLDDQGAESRNPAQVVIHCQPTLYPSDIKFYRDAAMTDEIVGEATDCLDLYIQLSCFAGGLPSESDFTLARISTDDSYGPDRHNNVDPIDLVLVETGDDTKVFAGKVRLAACSNEDKAEIGISEGCTLTVSNNGYFATRVIGRQWYGLQTVIDHIEDGIFAFNAFDGVWCTYDDWPNGNSSVVTMASSALTPHPGSTQSMMAEGTLHLVTPDNTDQLFAGLATKLTGYENDVPQAVYDLSSTTGVKGISFWLLGNGTRVSVVLKSLAITNYDDYLYTIEHTPSNGWRRYQLFFKDFAQEGWGNQAIERDAALRHVNAIQFKFASKLDGEFSRIYVDDLMLFGGSKNYLPHPVYHKQNTLSMEGFDGGFLVNRTFDGPGAPGWTLTGNALNEDWGNWRIVLANWTGTNHGGAHQILSVQDSKAYQFSISGWKNAGFAGEAYVEMIWYDAETNYLGIDGIDITGELTEGAKTFTIPYRWAPEGASSVKIGVRCANGVIPPYADNGVQFDDADFSEYGLVADNGWIGSWIPGASISYSTNCAEGTHSMLLQSTNTDWLGGMFVAPYGTGETRTNYSAFSGFALKARRPDDFASSGNAQARIRIAVATHEDPVARTRWHPVGASSWGDYILFPTNKFYTAETVDENNPANQVLWTNTWTDIRRVIIEYGPSHESSDPYDVLVDDFRPYSDTYVPDDIIDPPITNSFTNSIPVFTDAGLPQDAEFAVWGNGQMTWDSEYAGETPPEGSLCFRATADQTDSWGIVLTQSCYKVATLDTPGQAWNIDIKDNHAFVADAAGGVRILDIADPASPIEIAHVPMQQYARDIKVVGDYAYVAASPFVVLNVADPANPTVVASTNIGNVFTLDIQGSYAYAVRRDFQGALAIVNIANPTNPVLTGTANLGSIDCHVRVTNNYAYVALQDTGFHVIDIADPANPVVLYTNRLTWCKGIDIAGNYAYVGIFCGMRVFDISSPATPVMAGSLTYTGESTDLQVRGNRAYIAGDGKALRIVDITSPGSPRLVGYSTDLGSKTMGLELSGNYAFIASYTGGVHVVDITQDGGGMDIRELLAAKLKFSVKTPTDLQISISAGGLERTFSLTEFNWSGLNEWQDMAIPLRDLGFSQQHQGFVTTPFKCKIVSEDPEVYYIDNIRFAN